MGREIRRVPANWEHPKEEKYNALTMRAETRCKPLYNRSCEEAWANWQNEFQDWIGGEHDRIAAEYGDEDYPKDQPYTAFCRWHGCPPDPEYYRPQWSEEEMTWWQVYETVSEGTPVTPPFETAEELMDYLVANGDFWDQRRRTEGVTDMDCTPWSREQAERFVKGSGWAPSLIGDARGLRAGHRA